MSFRETLSALEIQLTSTVLCDPASREQNKPNKRTLQGAVVSLKDLCLTATTMRSPRLLLWHSPTGDETDATHCLISRP